jgi:PIN domain nuclease of toxin-antitoxin system
MRALLDTHVFLWWALDDERLPASVRSVIGDGENRILVSAATAYELTLKASLGRVALPEQDPAAYVIGRLEPLGFDALSISAAHAARAAALPLIHRDPWDRILVAQAQSEGLVILTADDTIRRYDVETIW